MKKIKFNLEAALSGAKIVNRNGGKVGVLGLSRDRNSIVGLVERSSLGLQRWGLDGSYLQNGLSHDWDLFILDESEPVVDSHKADIITAYCDGRLSMLKGAEFLSGEDYYNQKFKEGKK